MLPIDFPEQARINRIVFLIAPFVLMVWQLSGRFFGPDINLGFADPVLSVLMVFANPLMFVLMFFIAVESLNDERIYKHRNVRHVLMLVYGAALCLFVVCMGAFFSWVLTALIDAFLSAPSSHGELDVSLMASLLVGIVFIVLFRWYGRKMDDGMCNDI
jgi:hypothetical protein